jgi:SPP1 gp7 family putative phage head morphogenesis protein
MLGASHAGAVAARMSNAQRTAAYVAAQRRFGLASPRRRVPRSRHPFLVESDYAAKLVALVHGWRDRVATLVNELPELLAGARQHRGDELETRTERLGLPIVIENPAGSVRHWTDGDGTQDETVMGWSYGYLEGFRGADGEDVDVYLGPVESPEWIFVIHQQSKATGFTTYDEDKIMLGWSSATDALEAYLAQYDDPRFFGGMTAYTAPDFLARLVRATGAKLTRADAWRLDIGEGRRTRVLLDRVREDVASAARATEQVAKRAGEQVSNIQRAELAKQTKAALGVDVPVADRNIHALIEHFAHENVALIKSLGNRTLDDIEKLVTGAYVRGLRAEDVAQEIARRFDIAERHARLIARDQIGRLNSQITRARHDELGIGKFRWLTMDDNRVRQRHRPFHGNVYPYRGEGTPEFFPGDEIMCRCVEQPVYDDILAMVDELLAA